MSKTDKKRHPFRTIINILCVLIIIGGAAGAYFVYNLDNYIASPEVDEYEPIVSSASTKKVEYYLVCGIDNYGLTDVIMMVCMDKQANKATIMQIPRDTYIGNDIPTGKINAVYGHPRTENGKKEGKAQALARYINNYFGLPVDRYMFFSLSSFRNIVDKMGGIDVNVTQRLQYKGVVVEKGQQNLDGAHAEVFMRFRSGYQKGDQGRVEAQRRFYAALAEKAMSMDTAKLMSIFSEVQDDIVSDMTYRDVNIAMGEAKKIDIDEIEIFAVPGEGYGVYGTRDNGTKYLKNSLYTVHKDDLVELINEKMLPYSTKISALDIKIEELQNSGYEAINSGETLGAIADENRD